MGIYSNSLSMKNNSLQPSDFAREKKHEVVSAVAYLIGVPEDKIKGYPQIERFPALSQDKNARIIRNLCIIRTAIERNFLAINNKMRLEYKSILSLPDLVPGGAVMQLSQDGVSFVKKSSTKLYQHIIEINRLISDRINNCKHLFPAWVKWEYVRDLFIMPNGLTEEGTKAAADEYYANKNYYPYLCYINWSPYDAGNILYDDKKFMTVLYEQHNDYFTEFNQTTDASNHVKKTIYEYIDRSRKIVIFVDCENSDPYKLCAALHGLNEEALSKISKIILFDDIHTTMAWQILSNYTHVPVEHLLIERIHSGKSLVDGRLIARACQEHYVNGVDAMILVSSDSDYWSLISSLPTADFLVMIESEKCGPNLKEALSNSKIFYCYLDDFYAGGGEELKVTALLGQITRQLKPMTFNLFDMLNEAERIARASMTAPERTRFYEKHLRRLELTVDAEGNVEISLRK